MLGKANEKIPFYVNLKSTFYGTIQMIWRKEGGGQYIQKQSPATDWNMSMTTHFYPHDTHLGKHLLSLTLQD